MALEILSGIMFHVGVLWMQLTKNVFFCRHHTYKKTDHKNVALTEVGPRFEMKREYSLVKPWIMSRRREEHFSSLHQQHKIPQDV